MVRFVPIALACLGLGACSTTVLGQAQSLASAGKQAATSTSDFLATPAQQTETFYEGLTIASAFPIRSEANPGGCNMYGLTAPDAAFQKEVDDYLSALASTEHFFTRLAKVYDSFGALAAYDASGAVEKNVNDLSAAVNDFAGKVGGPTVPANISGVIASVGGLAAQERQKQKILAASKEIRTRVQAYATAMRARPGLFTNARQEQINQGYKVAETLWCAGVMDARPMLKGIAADYGMDLPAGQAAITSKDPIMAPVAPKVLKFRSKRDVDQVDQAFSQILDGLDDLAAQHEKLEKGAPIDIDGLADRTAKLRALVELYAKKG